MEYYYCPDLSSDHVSLSPDESKHCIKSMHHRAGDTIFLIDGQGCLAKAVIVAADKQLCHANIIKRTKEAGKREFCFHLAIAPTKNRDRIEWLVEKSIEIGIEKISLVVCDHSERARIDLQRLERVAIAAIKQSQTAYLPEIESLSFSDFLARYAPTEACKLIAWCQPGSDAEELARTDLSHDNIILLIGPEGDFSPAEVNEAKEHGFKEIRLGNKRLRTETAGLYGCCIIAGRRL